MTNPYGVGRRYAIDGEWATYMRGHARSRRMTRRASEPR